MSAILDIRGAQQVALSITDEALALKAKSLSAAREITEVADKEALDQAAAVVSDIKGLLKKLESSRTDIKRPVLDLGKRIDAVAQEYAKELAEQANRLQTSITAYYRAEAEKAEAQRKMMEALAEKRRLKAEAEARAADEERRRLEAAARASEDREKAAALEKAAAERQAAAEASRLKAEASAPAPVAAPAKAEKMSVRKVWKYRVTNIHEVYRHKPELVTLEPRANAILAEIRSGMTDCPGLEIWSEDDVVIRS